MKLLETLKKEVKKYFDLDNSIKNLMKNINIKDNEYLAVKNNNKYTQYYKCLINPQTKELERVYIPKKDLSIAQELANKSFYNKVSKIIEERLSLLNGLIDSYENKNIEDFYYSLIPERRELINMIVPTWEQRFEKWRNEEYQVSKFPFESIEIYTKKGERVRSKSEKILGDIFTDYGVEYIYEKPLYLENREVIYVDFTIMPKNSDKVVYWEHFGMMDKAEYVNNFIKKIELYARNGIYYGENLFFSFESSNMTFDIKNVERIIKKFLI